MAVNPIDYAVKIALSMEAGAAFESVRELEENVLGLEDRLQTFLTNFSSQIPTAFKNLNDAIVSVNASVSNQTGLYSDASNAVLDVAEQAVEIQKTVEETALGVGKLSSLYIDITNNQTDYKNIQIELEELVDNRNRLTEDFKEMLEDILVNSEDILENSDRFNESIRRNNGELGKQRKEKETILGFVKGIYREIDSTIGALARMSKGTEDFTTANYRAYGSQHELLLQSDVLASTIGMFGDAAKEAYRELMNIRIPKEMSEEYVKTVVMVGRVTGMSTKTIVDYTKAMGASGSNANSTSESYLRVSQSLAKLSYAQERYNLTAAEATKIAEIQTDKMNELRFVYGEGFSESIGTSLAMMADMAKEAGVSMKAVEDLGNIIQSTGEDAIYFAGAYGPDFDKGAEERFDLIMDKTAELAEKFAEANDMTDIGARNEALMEMQGQAGIYGITDEMIRSVAAKKKLAEDSGQSLADYLKKERDEINKNAEINKQFKESMDTLYAAYERIKTQLAPVITLFVTFVSIALIPTLNAISKIIEIITKFIVWIKNMWLELEKAIPIVKDLRVALVFVASAITSLVIIVPTLVTAFTALSSVMLTLGTRTSMFRSIFGGLINFMRTSVVSLGNIINTFLITIGRGIAAFGKAIMPAIIPLIVLSVVILAVSFSALMFAKAVQIVAEVGPGAVKIIWHLVMAIGALFAIILIAAAITYFLMAPMIVLAGVVLTLSLAFAIVMGSLRLFADGITMIIDAVANAAMKFAEAFGLMAQHVEQFFNAVSMDEVAVLIAFSFAVGGLGVAGVLSAVGIAALALELLALGTASTTLASNLVKISEGIDKIMNADISKFKSIVKEFKAIVHDLAKGIASSYAVFGGLVIQMRIFESVTSRAQTIGTNVSIITESLKELSYYSSSGFIALSGIIENLEKLNKLKLNPDALAGIDGLISDIEKLNQLKLGQDVSIGIDGLVADIEKLNNLEMDITAFEDQVNKFNNLELNPDKLISSIIETSNRLQDVVGLLSLPTEELSGELSQLTSKLEEINRIQSEIEKVSMLSRTIPTEDRKSDQTPNEFRKVEKANEVITTSEPVNQYEERTISILERIASLLDKKEESGTPMFDPIIDYDSSADLYKAGIRT
jgi:DNA-binding ferritin-like protein